MKRIILFIMMMTCAWLVHGQLKYSPKLPAADEMIRVEYNPQQGQGGFKDTLLPMQAQVRLNTAGSPWHTIAEFAAGVAPVFHFRPSAVFADIPAQATVLLRFTDESGDLKGLDALGNPFEIYVGYRPVRQFQGFSQEGNRVEIESTDGKLALLFLASDIVKVEYANGQASNADTSHAVVLSRGQDIDLQVSELPGRLQINAEGIHVEVEKSPLRLVFKKPNGTLLFAEEVGAYIRPATRGFRFKLSDHEAIWGTGARAVELDRRGQKLELYNQPHYGYGQGAPNLNYCVPVYESSRGYMVLFDNAQKGYMDIGATRHDVLELGAIGGDMDYVVLTAGHPLELQKNYAKLTGFQPLPPIWALGNLTSRFGYETQAHAQNVVDSMQLANFPLDAIIIDLFWFGYGDHGKFFMGDLEWNRDTWPKPEKMMKGFRNKGVKTILITEPFVLEESRNFDYTSENKLLARDENGGTNIIEDFYFGPSGLLDIFKPEARDWFWSKYQQQIEKGVAGWWGDLGEPETHPSDLRHVVGTADQVHNIYGHYWHKMLYERYRKHYPEKRLFNLNRSGFAGSQRYAIFPWSGDVSRSWSGLRAQLPIMLGMATSGLPYMHSDLGGFAMGTKDEGLYTRWLQFGAFNPVFRPHGSGIPSEPIYFSEATQDIVRDFIALRYRMIPYNYTLAWEASAKGLPLARPMHKYHTRSPHWYNLDSTYYWGDDLLVAPILHKNQKTKKIYLPEGEWVDFWKHKAYTGGQWLEYPVEMETIPVFARAGAFITFAPLVHTTDNYSTEKLTIRHYPPVMGQEAYSELYMDDGKTPGAWDKGLYELNTLKAYRTEEVLAISLGRKAHPYEGMPESREITWKIWWPKEKPGAVIVNGKPLKTFRWEDAFIVFQTKQDMETLNLEIR